VVFHVPESKRSIDQDKFEFDVPAFPGQTFQVPRVKYLPLASMEVLQGPAGNVTLLDILDLFAKVDESAVAAARRALAEPDPEPEDDSPEAKKRHGTVLRAHRQAQREARAYLEEQAPAIATRNAVRSLDTEQLHALTMGWQKDSGITLGESSGSAN
jgi:hypothetical protein